MASMVRTIYVQRVLKEGWKVGFSDELGWHWYRPLEDETMLFTEMDARALHQLLGEVFKDGE